MLLDDKLKMEIVGMCSKHGKKRKLYMTLVGNSDTKRQLGRHALR
jgi:hypothetical protein